MKKLYILIRKDLSFSQQAVQAGHAVAQFMLEHGQVSEWKNHTLIYLGVEDERSLTHWTEKMNMKNLQWTCFREPDIGDQMTAIACYTDSRIFSNLRLI